MKKNKMIRVMSFMLSAVMLSSFMVSTTISRYITEVQSFDNTRVAVWDINANEVTMNLFNTIYTDENTGVILAESRNGENIIAPGTHGESLFSIVNHENNVAPEVMYKLEIDLDDSQVSSDIVNNDYIQWKLDDGSWGSWDQLKISLYSLVGNASGVETYKAGELVEAFKKGVTHKISWQWLISDVDINTMTNEDYAALLSVKVSAKQTNTVYHGALEGENNIVNIHEEIEPVSIRSSSPLNEFVEIKLGDEIVDPSNYDLDTRFEENTIVTFKKSYLENLPLGHYTVFVVSENQIVASQLDIVDRDYVVDIGTLKHNGIIPEGGIYYSGFDFGEAGYGASTDYYNNGNGVIYKEGDKFPELKSGDIYVYGDYEYCYFGGEFDRNNNQWHGPFHHDGWGVAVRDTTKTRYGKILHEINGDVISQMVQTFMACSNLEISPVIPDTVDDLSYTFAYTKLTQAPVIPDGVIHLDGAFEFTKLKEAPIIPDSVQNISYAFLGTELINPPELPESIIYMDGAFNDCKKLVSAPLIPSSVQAMSWAFLNCINLTGEVEINANPYGYEDAFAGTTKPITLIGSSSILNDIAAGYGNVTVGN